MASSTSSGVPASTLAPASTSTAVTLPGIGAPRPPAAPATASGGASGFNQSSVIQPSASRSHRVSRSPVRSTSAGIWSGLMVTSSSPTVISHSPLIRSGYWTLTLRLSPLIGSKTKTAWRGRLQSQPSAAKGLVSARSSRTCATSDNAASASARADGSGPCSNASSWFSIKRVSRSAARKAGWSITRRRKSRLPFRPLSRVPASISLNRRQASSRSSPQAISLAIIGS